VFELSERCGDQTLVHHLAELVGVIDIKDTHEGVTSNHEIRVHSGVWRDP